MLQFTIIQNAATQLSDEKNELTMSEEALDSDNLSIVAFFDHSGEKPIQLSDREIQRQ